MAVYHLYDIQSPSLTLDANLCTFPRGEETCALDESITGPGSLDSSIGISALVNGSRRDSFTIPTVAIYPPKADKWQHLEMRSASSQNSFEQICNVEGNGSSNNSTDSFMEIDSQPPVFIHNPTQWVLEGNEISVSNIIQGHDRLPLASEVSSPIYAQNINASFTIAPESQNLSLSSPTFSYDSIPTSPLKEWSHLETLESCPRPKRIRHHSPFSRSNREIFRRGDCARKKNAKFEIPAELNLENIDRLITEAVEAGNNDQIKERKQYKRLLRNRQAALDSRNRKRVYTERLEDEKKQQNAVINILDGDLAKSKVAVDNLNCKLVQSQRILENMRLEREELIRHHTIESGDLREKVRVLTGHLQRLEMTQMSPPPSASSFSPSLADLDGMKIDQARNADSSNEIGDEPGVKLLNSQVLDKMIENIEPIDSPEKPVSRGILLLLLLFGAFVTSKGSLPTLPAISEEVHTASTKLLENILNDAGVKHAASSVSESSSNTWSLTPVMSMGGNRMHSITQSRICELADFLARPVDKTKEQSILLTAIESDSFTSHVPSKATHQESVSQIKRNFLDTFMSIPNNDNESIAEDYSQLLLWDRLPLEVMRKFAAMNDF